MYAPSLACSLGTTVQLRKHICSLKPEGLQCLPSSESTRIIWQGRSWLPGMLARVSNVSVSSTFKSSFRMSFYFFTFLFLPLVILLSAELCPMSKFHLLLWCCWVVQQTIHVQGPSNIMPFKECLAAIYKLSYWVWELNIAWDST